MDKIFEQIAEYGLVPVIKLYDVAKAAPLATALYEGGLPVAEVTFRTPIAAECIAEMVKKFPDMLVGAGTVCSVAQAEAAAAAGAKFIVAPGLNPTIVSWCLEHGMPVAPGIMTPSDLEVAQSFGLDFVKFFPAETAGGIASLKAMSAPYGNIKFMPTGGINIGNMHDYFANSKVMAIGGSFMAKEADVEACAWNKISADTRKAILSIFNFRLEKIRIGANDSTAKANAELASSVFGFAFAENAGAFASTNGLDFIADEENVIVISSECFDRALKFLARKGIEIDESLSVKNEKGKLVEAVLKNKMFGFRVSVVGR